MSTNSRLLVNPRITSEQLLSFRQARFNTFEAVEKTIHNISLLTFVAGHLLNLPVNLTATAIILLQRYLVLRHSLDHELDNLEAISATILLFVVRSSTSTLDMAKSERYMINPSAERKISTNMYAYLLSPKCSPLRHINRNADAARHDKLQRWEGREIAHEFDAPPPFKSTSEMHTYLIRHETAILATLDFTPTAATPYSLTLAYLAIFKLEEHQQKSIQRTTIGHLNAALLSPQLLYLTHQPHALAVAAIYLSAKDERVELVDEDVPWWEVFDVSQEELGFLVLSLASIDR